MKIIKCVNSGFAAILSDTIRHISHCLNNSEEWYIHWDSNCLYYDEMFGTNTFEYFFKQSKQCIDDTCIVEGYVPLQKFDNLTFRETANHIIDNHIQLIDSISGIINVFWRPYIGKKILGVHIRRTDKFINEMFGETPRTKPVDLENFVYEIDLIKDTYDFIYLATDCSTTMEYMKNIYGDKIIILPNIDRGNNTTSIHNNYKHISGYKKGLDVIFDIYNLSKCDFLIRSTSNVSAVSMFINPTLDQLNMNEKYYGDTCEKEFWM